MIQELRLREPNCFDLLVVSFDFIRTFFGWWYGEVPFSLLTLLNRTLLVLDDITSFSIILTGFFKPWKNDYNIAGWLVGIVIKSVYLPAASVIFAAVIVVFIAIILLQLLLLPVVIGLILINPFLSP